MHLIPAPLIATATFLWSFREWRRQSHWTPRLAHGMAALALATIACITRLLFLGPKYLGRRRAPARERFGLPDEPPS